MIMMNKQEILQRIADIECRSSLPKFKKNYTDKDYAIKELEKIIFELLDYIEEHQAWFMGVDLIHELNNLTFGGNDEKEKKEKN